jgi:undecaprenyl diphosphate synthase
MPARNSKRIDPVPSHLALIPDGNRRWSRHHSFSLYHGYDYGIKKFMDFGMWAKSFGVKTITVWALSTENVKKRSRLELGALYQLYIKSARDPAILARLAKNQARVRIIGNLRILPKKLEDALRYLEKATLAYKELTINILVGYGGKEDILYAFKSLQGKANNARGVDEEFVAKHIRTASIPDVDLIIRTSGEMRLSGFLPWQSDYSELYFAKKYWPDFEKRDLERALREFAYRERRFGR